MKTPNEIIMTRDEQPRLSRTLIIPAAGKSSRYHSPKPKWLMTHPNGKLMIEEVISGMNIEDYEETYIVILKEHCEKYSADIILNQIFGKTVKVTILDSPTRSAPETAVECITKNKITGRVIIKDCDCLVSFTSWMDAHFKTCDRDNFVVGLDIHSQNVKNLASKSFIDCDENGIVRNIVEKRVISPTICLGVYSLDSKSLLKAYADLSSIAVTELYFSHIVSHLILKGELFMVYYADKYIDWGTAEEWEEYISNLKTYIFDIDGVLLENRGRYGSETWENTFIPIKENIKILKNLSDEGAEIIFITCRTEAFLGQFIEFLKEMGIQYKTIITGCNHNKRIIVNDFFTTNPYPSCEAINIPRNGNLKDYI